MPNVECLVCGLDIFLDAETYGNYSGEVVCPPCKNRQTVRIEALRLIAANRLELHLGPIWDIINHTLPPDRLADLMEAAIDQGNNCFKSCVVMCRRALEGTLIEKGMKGDTVHELIGDAAKQKLLDETQATTARSVRFFGVSGAHPFDPELRTVTQFEAAVTLQITKSLMQRICPLKEQASQNREPG